MRFFLLGLNAWGALAGLSSDPGLPVLDLGNSWQDDEFPWKESWKDDEFHGKSFCKDNVLHQTKHSLNDKFVVQLISF